MDRALWITWYDLPASGRDAYLTWLHGSYIPKLLKKPGVLWAGHYACDMSIKPLPILRHSDDKSIPAGNSYILIFCGKDAYAFAGLTPYKLHAELPAEDKKMLAMRIGERVNLVTEEGRADGPAVGKREGKYALSPCIQLGSFNINWPDEDEALSWYAHYRLPTLHTMPGCIGIRKMVSVSGWAKHVVLYEFVSAAEREKHFRAHIGKDPAMAAWSETLVRKLLHAPGSPNVANRIWPPVKKG